MTKSAQAGTWVAKGGDIAFDANRTIRPAGTVVNPLDIIHDLTTGSNQKLLPGPDPKAPRLEAPKVSSLTNQNNDFNNWLNKGDANNTVYLGIKNGEPVYTGITKQPLNSRLGQHVRSGKDIDYLEPLYEDLPRNKAKAHEQNLIENPIGSSNQLNKINSISPKNSYYDDAVNWAKQNK